MCSHKGIVINGFRVRRIRRPQTACTRLCGACATPGTSDADLLSEARTGLVRRCTSPSRQEPAPGTAPPCPCSRTRTCAFYPQGAVSPGMDSRRTCCRPRTRDIGAPPRRRPARPQTPVRSLRGRRERRDDGGGGTGRRTGQHDHYNTVRLHSAIGCVAPLDKIEGRAEAIWAERDRKLAEARRPNEPQELLTARKETPMIQLAVGTDAGSAGEQPARDSRPGCGRKAGAGMALCDCPRAPLEPFGPSLHASEGFRLPQASESLISEARSSSSR